jgi:peptidoglycan hydrolase CwlO-like protein
MNSSILLTFIALFGLVLLFVWWMTKRDNSTAPKAEKDEPMIDTDVRYALENLEKKIKALARQAVKTHETVVQLRKAVDNLNGQVANLKIELERKRGSA